MSDIPPPATPPPPGGSYVPPPPPPPGASGSSDRTVMVVLSYLGLLALIPYLTKKEDPDIMWHAKNGMGLLIGEVILWVGLFILQIVAGRIFAGLGCGMSVIGCVVWIGVLVLHIYCIGQAIGGKRPTIPVITEWAEKTL
jgi:uncharacterized membrane protein